MDSETKELGVSGILVEPTQLSLVKLDYDLYMNVKYLANSKSQNAFADITN